MKEFISEDVLPDCGYVRTNVSYMTEHLHQYLRGNLEVYFLCTQGCTKRWGHPAYNCTMYVYNV